MFKIIQHALEDVEVLLKIHENLYPDNGDDRIVKGIKKRIGESLGVRVTKVEDIPRDVSGKYRYALFFKNVRKIYVFLMSHIHRQSLCNLI